MKDIYFANMPSTESALIDCECVLKNIHCPDLVLLDASIAAVGSSNNVAVKGCIPGARFFDIEHCFSDKSSSLPHTLLDQSQFEQAAHALGVRRDSIIVVYDNLGIYSSARAWWNFKVMGHEAVFILDGGLPEWIRLKYQTVEDHINLSEMPSDDSEFYAQMDEEKLVTKLDILELVKAPNVQEKIIDARSQGRFNAKDPEPREGLRGGHMPNALNLPFVDLLGGGKFIGKIQALKKFRDLKCKEDDHLIFSCGSGLTACIDIMAAYECGYKNLSLYDGSWTEWALDKSCPVVSGS